VSTAAPTTFAPTQPVSLADSRAYCEQLTKTEAKNFYYGLKLLPEPRRSAMFALYAYMRLVDNIADGQDGRNVQQRMDALDTWTHATHAAIEQRNPNDGRSIWPAFSEMVARYSVPKHCFDEVIAGQRQDLESPAIHTFEELKQYCYRVAGVVGVASIHIFGFDGGDAAIALAVDRGVAFQLTNILRDLREDAERERIYLPRQELEAAGVSAADVRNARWTPQFANLMNQQIARANSFYASSAPLDEMIDRASRPTLTAMTQIYHGLLEKIAVDPQRVLHKRISLSPLTKLRIAWRAARSR
jgi:15-cis-phytoene synthase